MLDKLDEKEFPGKVNQLYQIARIVYDSLERTSWEEQWKDSLQSAAKSLSSRIAIQFIAEIAHKNIRKDWGSVTRMLLELATESQDIAESLKYHFRKTAVLDVAQNIAGTLSDESIQKRLSIFDPLYHMESLVVKGSPQVTDKTLEFLYSLVPNVHCIDLSKCWNLSPHSFSLLCKFSQLKRVFISSSMAHSDSFECLSSLQSLECIELKNCPQVSSIPKIPSLKRISFKNCSRVPESLKHFLTKENFPNLASLQLILLSIQDQHLQFLSEQFGEHLEELSVSHCSDLTNSGLQSISKFVKLKHFEGRYLQNVDEEIKIEWPRTVVKFDVKNCEKIGDNFVNTLDENVLEYIGVQNTQVSDIGLKHLLSNSWESAKVVKIKGCSKTSPFIKSKVIHDCPNLEVFTSHLLDSNLISKLRGEKLVKLKLLNCSLHFTDYETLLPASPRLEQLSLINSNVDDQVLRLISLYCSKLKKLQISDPNVTDKGLITLNKLHPVLRKLDVSGCINLSEKGMRQMLENARISHFRAFNVPSFGVNTLDILAHKCGFYLKKIEGLFLVEKEREKKRNFFFPNLEVFRGSLLPRVCLSLSALPRLRKGSNFFHIFISSSQKKIEKVHAVRTFVQNESLSNFRNSTSLESFSSLMGTTVSICADAPTFLSAWSRGPIASSLRFLFLPAEVMSEKDVRVISNFKNLVYFPLQLTKTSPHFQNRLISLLPNFDPHYLFQKVGQQQDLYCNTSSLSIFSQEKFLPSCVGKVAVVARANYELQAAIVKRLSMMGFTVYALYDETNMSDEFQVILGNIEGKQENGKDEAGHILPINYIPNDKQSVSQTLKELTQEHQVNQIDLLIMGPYSMNSKSEFEENQIENARKEVLQELAEDYIYAPLYLLQVFGPILKATRDCKVLIISSSLGLITSNTSGGQYPLKMNLASLHQMIRNVSIEWRNQSNNITICIALPGFILSPKFVSKKKKNLYFLHETNLQNNKCSQPF